MSCKSLGMPKLGMNPCLWVTTGYSGSSQFRLHFFLELIDFFPFKSLHETPTYQFYALPRVGKRAGEAKADQGPEEAGKEDANGSPNH